MFFELGLFYLLMVFCKTNSIVNMVWRRVIAFISLQ